MLKYLPSEKAQDARNFVQSLQYWLGGNAENLENLLLNTATQYVPALKGANIDVLEPQLFPDVGIWHPMAPSARLFKLCIGSGHPCRTCMHGAGYHMCMLGSRVCQLTSLCGASVNSGCQRGQRAFDILTVQPDSSKTHWERPCLLLSWALSSMGNACMQPCMRTSRST